MSNQASLKITVTTYRSSTQTDPTVMPATAFCAANSPVFLTDNQGDPINASNQVGIDSADATYLWVQRKNAANSNVSLQFTIVSPSGATLTPTAIVLKQQQGSGDATGTTNFPTANRSNSGTTITIEDSYQTKGKRGDNTIPKWKYYIKVADSVTSTFGWIDPGIENSDEN